MATTCPNYNDPVTVKQFNSVVESFGGNPLSLEEFKSVELRRQRETVDRFAMDVAYYLWDKHLGNIDDINYDDEAIEYRRLGELGDIEELSQESTKEPDIINFNAINAEQYSLSKQDLPTVTPSEKVGKSNVEEIESKSDIKIPTKTQLKKELGFYKNMSYKSVQFLKKRIDAYNVKNKTSHGLEENRMGESHNYNPDIVINFNPRDEIKAAIRKEVRSEDDKLFSDLQEKLNYNTSRIRNNVKPELIKVWGEDFINNAFNNFDQIFPKYAELLVTEAERWIFIKKYLDGEFKILC